MDHEITEERRASTRFKIHAAAVATLGTTEIWAFTRDISTRAVYFRTEGCEARRLIGETLSFLIKIPPSMSYSKPCFIRGRGRIIRIEDLEEEEAGLVVEISDYNIESGDIQETQASTVTTTS